MYKGAFIRKSTALYLLQENCKLSNDRLLRVWSNQPTHLSSSEDDTQQISDKRFVRIGDLCIFRQQDSNKLLLGRVIQFSYLLGNKKERAFSSSYVDMTKTSYKDIGVFANWFARLGNESPQCNAVHFDALDFVFTTGYLSMDNYVASFEHSDLLFDPSKTLSVKCDSLGSLVPDWKQLISCTNEFLKN